MMSSVWLLIIFFIVSPVMVCVSWVFYAMLKRYGIAHIIYDIPISNQQKQQEIKHFIPVMMTHTLVAAFFIYSGLLPFVLSTNIGNLILSIVVALVVQEVWYFISHVLMHRSKLLWKAHRPHHKSIICTGYTGVSFSLAEKFIFSFGVFIIYSILAWYLHLSFEGIAFVYLIYFAVAVRANFNLESYSANFVDFPILKYLTSSTYHALHHTYPATNFGLYTRLFDIIFKTDNPDYEILFKKSAREKGLKTVRES